MKAHISNKDKCKASFFDVLRGRFQAQLSYELHNLQRVASDYFMGEKMKNAVQNRNSAESHRHTLEHLLRMLDAQCPA